MTVITNVVLKVRERVCNETIIRIITVKELLDEGQEREVEINATVISPNNKESKTINAFWNTQFNILMPVGSSNIFERFIICKENKNNSKANQVKYFENANRRKKLILDQKTSDINVVQKWIDEKDVVYAVAKSRKIGWEKYRVLAINEDVFYAQDEGLICYYI